jgi:hypothetical protein
LRWLRAAIQQKQTTTAEIAKKADLDRNELRRALTGTDPMTLDQLLAVTQALELDPKTIAALSGQADLPEEPPAPPAPPAGDALVINPWGNHQEQLFRAAFTLGVDVYFVAETSALADSGLPKAVLRQYAGSRVPVKLDAAFHSYNNPRYSEEGITLTLSFDALYDCTFPWSAIPQIIFFPAPPPEPPVEEAEPDPGEGKPKAPFLRLVR